MVCVGIGSRRCRKDQQEGKEGDYLSHVFKDNCKLVEDRFDIQKTIVRFFAVSITQPAGNILLPIISPIELAVGSDETPKGRHYMDVLKRIAGSAIALALAVGTLSLGTAAALAQYGSQGRPSGPPPGAPYQGQGRWDAPPREYREAARKGFQDGLYGAQKDFENRRRWNVNNRDEFRRPNIAAPLVRDYKMGFKRGYDTGVRHYTQGGPGPR